MTAGPRVLRDAYLAPAPNIKALDDGRARSLDGGLHLRQAGRVAVQIDDRILVLDQRSAQLTDRDAVRVALAGAQPAEPEPRNLAERLERAIRRKLATLHNRVHCTTCGAQIRQRCVHREAGQAPAELDGPHDARIEADR